MDTTLERWSDAHETLRACGATPEQCEVIRRIGAARRHAARVAAAAHEVHQVVIGIIGVYDGNAAYTAAYAATWRVVAAAIDAALDCIGMPGSRCGSAPPSWYTASPHVHARVAAMREALYQRAPTTPADSLVLTAEGERILFWSGDRQIGSLSTGEQPILAEHVLATYLRQAAFEVDGWLRNQSLPQPPLPDADLCALYQQVMRRRRGPTASLASYASGAPGATP